jgi:hypothetical protein
VVAGAAAAGGGGRLAPVGERGGDVERGLAEHRLDERELGAGELGRDHGEAGAAGLIGGQRRERRGLGGPPLDERQLEAAPPEHAAHVAQHAQIEAGPPRCSHCA